MLAAAPSLLLAGSRPARAGRIRFPIAVTRDGLHLVDADKQPFLYQGDAAWLMFTRLTRDDAVEYLRDRRIRGFTAVHAMLTGLPGAVNRNGDRPFEGDDLGRPGERYFDLADQMLRSAEALDLVVALAPAWTGCCGEGWAAILERHGPERCRAYGRWLGERYRRFGNIVWLLGGNAEPSAATREPLRALAEGLDQAAPHHLIAHHTGPGRASTDAWPDDPRWLDLDFVHHDGVAPVAARIQERVARVRPRPVILGQGAYEGAAPGKPAPPPRLLREQAYAALAAGAAGHAYGAVALWEFTDRWRASLDLPGAALAGKLRQLLDGRPWQQLVPDRKGQMTADAAAAARTPDGKLAIIYVTSPKALTIDLRKVGPRRIRGTWFDPRTGATHAGPRAEGAGKLPFVPPTAAGVDRTEQDWVLILEEAAK